MSKRGQDHDLGGMAAQAPPADTAYNAARSVIEDWSTQVPIIEGHVGLTMVENLTDVVETFESGKTVEWRVSKGYFTTEEGDQVYLSTLAPTRKNRKDDSYAISGTNVILNRNPRHVAATIHHGHVHNDDDRMSAMLPSHPRGFSDMVKQIYRDSVGKVEEENSEASRKRSRRWQVARRAGAILALAAGLSHGIPATLSEINEYKDSKEAKAEAEADAQAEAIQLDISDFDAKYQTIEDGLMLDDQEAETIPATRQFAAVDTVPNFDYWPNTDSLEQVRALGMPAAGASTTFQIPIPTGKTLSIAHTGSPEQIAVAYLDIDSQVLRVTNVNLSGSAETVSQSSGEIIITYVDQPTAQS